VSSLQIALPLVWTEASRRGHRLDNVVGWMSTAPAALVGLSRKGRIEVGCDADLVVFAPDEPFVVDVGSLHHRHPVSPYSGHRLQGVVRSTWLHGQVVSGTSPHGQLISAEGA
jgi:allantoinase